MTASTDRPPGDLVPIAVQEYQTADRVVATQEGRRGFAAHATLFLVANVLMLTVNLAMAPDYLWFPFPLALWGFGLAVHYLFNIRRIDQEITNRQAKVRRRVAKERAA